MVKIVEFLDSEPKKDLNGETIYQDGKKTIQSFGITKRFAILRGVRLDDQGNIIKDGIRWFLFDQKENKDIDMDIEGYEYLRPYIVEKDEKGRYKHIYLPEDKLKSYVYTKGSKGYTRLNYETAEILQSYDINERKSVE